MMRAHSHHVINSPTDEYAEISRHLWLIWVQVLFTKATNAVVQKIKRTHFGQKSLTQISRSALQHLEAQVFRLPAPLCLLLTRKQNRVLLIIIFSRIISLTQSSLVVLPSININLHWRSSRLFLPAFSSAICFYLLP